MCGEHRIPVVLDIQTPCPAHYITDTQRIQGVQDLAIGILLGLMNGRQALTKRARGQIGSLRQKQDAIQRRPFYQSCSRIVDPGRRLEQRVTSGVFARYEHPHAMRNGE